MRPVLALVAAFALAGCLQSTGEGSSSGSSGAAGSGGSSTSSTSGATSGSAGTTTGSTTGGGTTTSGGTTTGSGTTSGGTTTGSGTTTGGSSGGQNSGACQTSADCQGQPCVEITPGGFRECQAPLRPAESCSGGGNDACCPDGSLTCPSGQPCVLGPAVPTCGGVVMQGGNVCAADQCLTDADCPQSELCAPAGTMGLQVRACVAAGCRTDADCTAQPGGSCAPVADPCCGTVYGLYCVYPGGCRSNGDCPSGYCATDGHTASCQPGVPACPV